MSKKSAFITGLLICALPFLFCFAMGRTFVPLNALRFTNLPYAIDADIPIPTNHFWVDTGTFYWPRLYNLVNGEFPISYSTGGSPNYADTISGFFSPLAILVFRILPAGIHSLDFFWLLEFSLYFSGFYLWMIAMGVSPLAALVASLSQFFCTTFFPGSYMSFQTLGALLFLPWAFWAELRFGKSRHRFWLPALFLALCIFGANIQTAIYPVLVYFFWGFSQRRIPAMIYTCCLSMALTLPFWLTGIEYHFLLNIRNLTDRVSQVPPDTLGRLRSLLAAISIFIPDFFGSSKTVDFLKAFQTSATYFIGSIGFIGPLLCLLGMRREDLRRKEIQFPLLLLAGTLLVMLTPLLNLLYYRIVCVACFALSVLLGLSFDSILKFCREKWLLAFGSLLLLCSLVAAVLKSIYADPIRRFLEEKLSQGSYSWSREITEQRIALWFTDYLTNPHFLALGIFLIVAYFARKKRKQFLLAGLIVGEVSLLWFQQVTFDAAGSPFHPIYAQMKAELQKSPSYPISRYMPLQCIYSQGVFFQFSMNEYQAVPSVILYGSTDVQRMPRIFYHCDRSAKTVRIRNPEAIQQGAVNLILTNPGWDLLDSSYTKILETPKFDMWRHKSIAAIWQEPLAESERELQVETKSFSGSGIAWRVLTKEAVPKWFMSLPYYPGWIYSLDGKAISPAKIEQAIPEFHIALTPGEHEVTAFFRPLMLYWGLLGSFFAIFIALWKSISIRA